MAIIHSRCLRSRVVKTLLSKDGVPLYLQCLRESFIKYSIKP